MFAEPIQIRIGRCDNENAMVYGAVPGFEISVTQR
jgi:hypothetical protein